MRIKSIEKEPLLYTGQSNSQISSGTVTVCFMKRTLKEKPIYSTLQNTSYVLNLAWSRNKLSILTMLIQSILVPAIPAVAMFLPMTVVALILSGTKVSSLIGAILVFTAAAVLLQTAKSYVWTISRSQRNGLRISINHDILDKMLTTDYANLEKQQFTDAREKAHDATGSPYSTAQQIYYTLENIGANLIGFVLYIVLLAQVNPLILLLTAATTAFGFFVRRRANKWQYDNDDEKTRYRKRVWYISRVGENTSLAKDIRLFSMIDWLRDVYKANSEMLYNWHRKMESKQYFADAADCIATFLREGAAYAYLIWMVLYRELPVDQFVLLFAAISGFSGWVTGILDECATLQRRSLEYCRLREYLEFPNEFKRSDGQSIAPEQGKDYTLELRNVSFRYSGSDEDTLQNINLTIHAGEKLAIVGLNGAGKTTLVKLLCGFYDPTVGEVLLNGCDIRVYDREQYYTLFTAVFQEFNILPVSIAENVAQENSGELDADRVVRCLEQADIYEKVSSLPEGMESMLRRDIFYDGVELSGGETQRLMLARALYNDAPILILDEPTAALDPIAESRLYIKYNELSAGKTSVYISHRLASTRFCDRVIFIDEKTIAEAGIHEELLAACGKYAELFEIQSKYYREEAGV